ncbi:hypothetical protein FGRMN_4644 [Fusarium graminum]|nr:hypothetical protein FGRMN_4644 [Fusarium graminum]
MSACPACHVIGEHPSAREFLAVHGHGRHWSLRVASEEARWRHAEAICEKEFKDALMKEYLTLFMDAPESRAFMTPEARQIHQENMRKARESRMVRGLSHSRARGLYVDDGTDDSPVTKSLTLCDPALETSVPIRVVEARFVREGRWYLGHPPGTFIFQYHDFRTCTEDGYQTIMGSESVVCELNFTYMGQVPRHPKLHAARVRQMWKFMLTLFISELQLKAGPRHLELYPDLEAMLTESHVQSADVFQPVWEHWERRSLEPGAGSIRFPDNTTRTNFSRLPHVQEFAWHMCTLMREHHDPNSDAPDHPIWLLLASSTGLPVEKLAGLWEDRLRNTAEEKLRSGSRENLFIYEVEPETEDIHQFYRQPPFDDDPINPRMTYTWPVYEDVPIA